MSHNPGILLTLAGNFALMSLFAMGGANAAFPEMYRLAVDVMHWMTDRQFADLYAIAQVTPGPNVIVVTLIGYRVAGLAGALVAVDHTGGPGPDLARSSGRLNACDRTGGRAVLADRGADAADRCGHLPAAVEPALDLRHRGGAWPGRGGLVPPVGFRKLSQLLPVRYGNVLITHGIAPVWERRAYATAGTEGSLRYG